MLDRALSTLFRHFATYFLLVAVLVMPLHVGFSYWHRDVIALSDIHGDIATLPGDRGVRGVGPDDLEAFRVGGVLLIIVELAALPVLVAAGRHIIVRDEEGRPPEIIDAWRHGFSEWTRLRLRAPGVLLSGAVLAAGVVLLARTAGHLVAEPLPGPVAWVGAAVAEGGARALGAPFFVAAAALATFSSKGGRMD